MKLFILVLLLLVPSGCQDNERLARLEKENETLKAQLQDKNKVRDYDLEVRCSKDAKAWFREGRFGDKTTTMLIMNNHYQASSNQCMAFIEEHSKADPAPSWVNEMSLYNVYENERIGKYFEEHNIDTRWNAPKATEDKVLVCEMLSDKCKNIDEFNAFVDKVYAQLANEMGRPYRSARLRLERAIAHGERIAKLWNEIPNEVLCTPKARFVDVCGNGEVVATNVGVVPDELVAASRRAPLSTAFCS